MNKNEDTRLKEGVGSRLGGIRPRAELKLKQILIEQAQAQGPTAGILGVYLTAPRSICPCPSIECLRPAQGANTDERMARRDPNPTIH